MVNKKKILFMTNVPSPYRVDFFNELGKHCELTVTFEKNTSDERHESWKEYKFENFSGVILNGINVDYDTAICFEIIKFLSDNTFDDIIISDFLSPTGMIAIEYLRLKKRKYWLESDGGFVRHKGGIKAFIKRHFIKGAYGYFSTAPSHDEYYIQYGAKVDRIYRYPFTSLSQKDLLPINPSQEEKQHLRTRLKIKENYVLLVDGTVFRNLDDCRHLANIARSMGCAYGFYILGSSLVQEMMEKLHFNIENIRYCKLDMLTVYCRAADVYVVLNDNKNSNELCTALANGLPLVSIKGESDASELIHNNKNALQLSLDEEMNFKNKLVAMLHDQNTINAMGEKSRETIAKYAVQKMPSEIYRNIICEGYHGWVKEYLRKELHVNSKYVILAVGQFIHRKGFDVLLKAANLINDNDVQFIFVGGLATPEYLKYVEENNLKNVQFLGFKTKEELRKYYVAADIMIHPTREDIWGLVINEAVSCLCPVISTDRCIAAEQLVKPSCNGFIIPTDDSKAIAESIFLAIELVDTHKCINSCIDISREFTIEQMSLRHLEVLSNN